MSEQQPATASAGIPNGTSPSGAASPGSVPADNAVSDAPAGSTVGDGPSEQRDRQVPGQPTGSAVSPVPSPGDVPGTEVPAVFATEGPRSQTGDDAGEQAADGTSTTSSPGSYVALTVPGHPDGEVDTRAR